MTLKVDGVDLELWDQLENRFLCVFQTIIENGIYGHILGFADELREDVESSALATRVEFSTLCRISACGFSFCTHAAAGAALCRRSTT